MRAEGLAYRSQLHGPDEHQVNPAFGGRIVCRREPAGQVRELLTVGHERRTPPADR